MSKRDEMEQDKLEYAEKILYKTIGTRISMLMNQRSARRDRGLTQEEIAAEIQKKTGVSCSRSTVARWISGTRTPRLSDLILICEGLDCSLDYLCGVKEKKRDNEAAERYTGLIQESVQYLHSLQKQDLDILNSILKHDSGLDSILSNIKEARSVSDINWQQIKIELGLRYYKMIKLRSNLVSFNDDRFHDLPVDQQINLVETRDHILTQLDLLQLQEYKQENNKRKIRAVLDQMLDVLIPAAKSIKYPDLEKIRQELLEDAYDLDMEELEEFERRADQYGKHTETR